MTQEQRRDKQKKRVLILRSYAGTTTVWLLRLIECAAALAAKIKAIVSPHENFSCP
jgi:hypothetical protein